MKGKTGYVIVGIMLFLVGVLVGELAGGGLGKKKGVVLSTGQSLEDRLAEIDRKLADIDKQISGGGLDRNKEYKFELSGAPVLGSSNAKVKLVLWSDFQCPFCKNMHQALESMVKSNPDNFALYMKDRVVHPAALIEHEAALAAQAQGKFWEFADQLFANQGEFQQLSQGGEDAQAKIQDKLLDIAKNLGLNVDQFKSDLDSHNIKPVIDKEQEEASAAGINSTPTVLINGYFYGFEPEELKTKAAELLTSPEKPKAEGLEAKLNSIDQKVSNLVKFFESRKQAQQPRGPQQGKEYKFDLAKSPVIGNPGAKVKVVVFSDFQCPYCEKMGLLLESVQKEHSKEVAIYFENYVVHPPAGPEHEAAMSANSQGKFRQMHDLLFKNRAELIKAGQEGEDKLVAKILELGKEAGLNVSQLKTDLEKGTYRELIAANMKEGQAAGVSGTPSVFVNGYFYGYNADDIKNQILEAIKK